MDSIFLMKPESVCVTQAEGKDDILRRLSDLFAEAFELDAAAVLDNLEEREKLGSTGFGRGVAIPHARMPEMTSPVAALMKLERPVAFAAADGLPVSLVFGLLSPAASGATHLHALAAISRLVRDERVNDALCDATDREALYSVLTNAMDRDAA
ncbi:MAG: PTS sugar transporter subunit IIA [Alteraurantiacibacter sp.]